jgi:hypothetical protein
MTQDTRFPSTVTRFPNGFRALLKHFRRPFSEPPGPCIRRKNISRDSAKIGKESDLSLTKSGSTDREAQVSLKNTSKTV